MFDLTSKFRAKKMMTKDEFGGSLLQNQQRSRILAMEMEMEMEIEMEMEMEMDVCCTAVAFRSFER